MIKGGNKRVVFLDRDGVINRYPGHFEYVKSWKEFHFLPKVKSSLKKLSDAGFKIFIVSNQAGVAKGIYSRKNLDLITERMLMQLSSRNISISGVYYCTHKEQDNCACRKPKTGLINMAVAKLKAEGSGIELKNSYLVGDSIRDIESGKKAGLKTMLVFSGKERPENKGRWMSLPDFTARSLSEAVDIILKQ